MDDRIREHLNRQFHIGSFTVSGVWLLYLLGMTVLGIVIRGAFLPYVSQDYTGYWEKWFAEIHRYGGMASLSHDFLRLCADIYVFSGVYRGPAL